MSCSRHSVIHQSFEQNAPMPRVSRHETARLSRRTSSEKYCIICRQLTSVQRRLGLHFHFLCRRLGVITNSKSNICASPPPHSSEKMHLSPRHSCFAGNMSISRCEGTEGGRQILPYGHSSRVLRRCAHNGEFPIDHGLSTRSESTIAPSISLSFRAHHSPRQHNC